MSYIIRKYVNLSFDFIFILLTLFLYFVMQYYFIFKLRSRQECIRDISIFLQEIYEISFYFETEESFLAESAFWAGMHM